MTVEGFRKLALSMPGAVESAQGNNPDFRAGGKVFASLGYPDAAFGMVKLTPEQQAAFIERQPGAFEPCKGVWGQRGATREPLADVTISAIQEALMTALQNVTVPKRRK